MKQTRISGLIHHSAGIAAIVVGVLAGTMAFVAAQPYPGATVDSGEYLAVADGIVDGAGLTMPYVGYDEPFRVIEPGERVSMTQFPPLYPALLATARWAGLSLLEGARLLGAFCFALTGWAVGGLVFAATKRTDRVLLAGALLLTADLVIIHAMTWSETVMLAALMAALIFWIRYVNDGRLLDLGVAAAWVIVASAARFVGLAAAAAIVVALLFEDRDRIATRMARASLFAAASSVPTIAWFVRNASILGTPSEKEIGWYLPGVTHVAQALSTVGGWVIPWKTAMPFVGGAIVISAGIVSIRRPHRRPAPSSVPRACLWFGVAYGAFVLLSRSVLDQNISFDFRILSPLYVLVVVGICAAPRDFGPMATLVLAVLAAGAIVRGVVAARDFSGSSVAAYTGDVWRRSPTLAYAGRVSDDAVLITNAPDPIWIWHDRTPIIIPPRSSLYSGEPNEQYSRDVAEIRVATRCREAFVVFFDQPTRKPRRYIEPLLVRGLRLERIERFSDGEIYDASEPRCGRRA